MSVRFSSGTDWYTATTGLPSSSVWTVTMWAKQVVAGTEQGLFNMSANPPGSQNMLSSDGTTAFMGWWDFATYSGPALGVLQFTTGTWYRIAFTVSGATANYYRATSSGSLTPVTATDWTPSSTALLRLGAGFTSLTWNGEVAAVKLWNAALNATEVAAELTQFDPVRTSGLLRYHKLKVPETTDYSGNGNSLTAGATTPSTGADNPPIPDIAVPLRLPIRTIQVP